MDLYVEKIATRYCKEQVLCDIIATVGKTNVGVDKSLGLE